jgi:hypothetical protein
MSLSANQAWYRKIAWRLFKCKYPHLRDAASVRKVGFGRVALRNCFEALGKKDD